MIERCGDFKGMQGKRYRLWKTQDGYEVEQVWGGNGVIFKSENVMACKRYLAKECRAERVVHGK